MYDPSIGRWLSEDPIGFDGGDANLYRFVGNDPVNHTDPTGTTQAGNPLNNLFGGCSGGKVAAYKPPSQFVPNFNAGLGLPGYSTPNLAGGLSSFLPPATKAADQFFASQGLQSLANPSPLSEKNLGPSNRAPFHGASPTPVLELLNGRAPDLLDLDSVRVERQQAANAAKFGEIRPVNQAQIDASRFGALSRQGFLTTDEQRFVDTYATIHDPFAFSNASIDVLAAFVGGYTPENTPLSARQTIEPVRGPNASRPPSVHGSSFEYVGETHVYAIRGPEGKRNDNWNSRVDLAKGVLLSLLPPFLRTIVNSPHSMMRTHQQSGADILRLASMAATRTSTATSAIARRTSPTRPASRRPATR